MSQGIHHTEVDGIPTLLPRTPPARCVPDWSSASASPTRRSPGPGSPTWWSTWRCTARAWPTTTSTARSPRPRSHTSTWRAPSTRSSPTSTACAPPRSAHGTAGDREGDPAHRGGRPGARTTAAVALRGPGVRAGQLSGMAMGVAAGPRTGTAGTWFTRDNAVLWIAGSGCRPGCRSNCPPVGCADARRHLSLPAAPADPPRRQGRRPARRRRHRHHRRPALRRCSWNAPFPLPAPGGRLPTRRPATTPPAGTVSRPSPPSRTRCPPSRTRSSAGSSTRTPRSPGRPDRAGRPGGRTRAQRRHADRARRGRTAAAGRGGGTARPPSAARARRTARRAVGDDTAACARGGAGGRRDGVAAGSRAPGRLGRVHGGPDHVVVRRHGHAVEATQGRAGHAVGGRGGQSDGGWRGGHRALSRVRRPAQLARRRAPAHRHRRPVGGGGAGGVRDR